MQRKCADFARLQVVLSSIQEELKCRRLSSASWCDSVKETIAKLEMDHGIVIGSLPCTTRRTRSLAEETSDIQHFQTSVAVPYIDHLLENIQNRFSDKAVEILVAASVLSPSLFPSAGSLSSYGEKEIKVLAMADFYGKEVKVEFDGTVYTSPPVLNDEDLIAEW